MVLPLLHESLYVFHNAERLVLLLQEAYRRWVCASLFPNFLADGTERARPCRSV
jgi:hypothetical protein